MSNDPQTTNSSTFLKGKRKVVLIAAGTVLAISSVAGLNAFAETKTYAHMKQFASSEHGAQGRHGRHGDLADMSDAEIEAKITRMVKHVAIEIDATDEQSEKITALVTAVAKDLKPIRDQVHATGRQIHDLLAADTIDRVAMEQLRTERLAEIDRISKNLLIAVADVAEVLTPEQRKVLDQRMQEFRGKRGGWHRG